MLAITPQMRILVAVEAVDFRKGIDSIAQLCREKLDSDPFSGCLFIFRSRRGTAIKLLAYDGQGFWLATKRLSALSRNSTDPGFIGVCGWWLLVSAHGRRRSRVSGNQW
jgi:hypothetical protein